MEISADTTAVVEFLDYASGGTLKQANLLSVLLEISAQYDLSTIIEDLIFKGSALNLILKSDRSDLPDSLSKRLQEIHSLTNDIKNAIAKIAECSVDSKTKDEIIENFLSDSGTSKANIQDLSYDLHLLKQVQKTMKNHIRNKAKEDGLT